LGIAKESVPYLAAFSVASAAAWVVTCVSGSDAVLWLAAALTLACAAVAFFFRDPHRAPPQDQPRAILSPADGRVIGIEEIDEPEFIGGKALKISIFLSLADVHINRIPVRGTVCYKKRHRGAFAAAFRRKASGGNARTCIGLDCGEGVKIAVKQIAGAVARRIICRAEVG
jgi:phosphatidylserine decarboxylase